MYENIRQVVVGFDATPHARAGLEWGIREALAWHCPLRVLVALGDGAEDLPESGSGSARVYADRMQDAGREAERVLESSPLEQWDVDLWPGSAVELLIAASGPEVITVVGSGGHGAVAGAVLGSVSQALVRQAEGPVVVCGRGPGHAGGPVTVGLDGTAESEHALDFALSRSEVTEEQVRALYAWRASGRPGTPSAGSTLHSLAHEVLEAERWLAEFAAGREADHPDLVIEREVEPLAPEEALIAASSDASLLVVGSRGRGPVESMVLGSVSQALLREAHCPVAVVR